MRTDSPLRLVVGIDPGTGMSSPTGLVIFNPDTKDIFYAKRVQPPKDQMALQSRLKYIAREITTALEQLDEDVPTTAFIETFVMRGKGGETLSRLTGAILTAIPDHVLVRRVANLTVKKAITGSGKADKQQVLQGLIDWSTTPLNENTYEWLRRVLLSESWDLADALAIGIAGDMGHGKEF